MGKFNRTLEAKNKLFKEKFLKRVALRDLKKKKIIARNARGATIKKLKKDNKILNYYNMLNSTLYSTLKENSNLSDDLLSIKLTLTNNKKTLLNNLITNRLYLNKNTHKDIKRKYLKTFKILGQYSLWLKKRAWILKKFRRFQITIPDKIRLKQNVNIEVNGRVYASTIIGKEFLFSPKFRKGKPVAFTYRINRFIKHFFNNN